MMDLTKCLAHESISIGRLGEWVGVKRPFGGISSFMVFWDFESNVKHGFSVNDNEKPLLNETGNMSTRRKNGLIFSI